MLLLLAAGCSSARRLDPVYAKETYQAELKFRFESGMTDPGLLRRIEAGDIIAFSSRDPSSASSVALAAAFSRISHVGIVIPFPHQKLGVLSADSERGVYIDTIERCVKKRIFYIYSFPPGVIDMERLSQFAHRAARLGTLDYDWSAVFGLNANLTPNTLLEVADEHTCATAVAAALHYSGLSLDRAWWGVVTPGDIIFSKARRNLNGPTVTRKAKEGGKKTDREAQMWESLR